MHRIKTTISVALIAQLASCAPVEGFSKRIQSTQVAMAEVSSYQKQAAVENCQNTDRTITCRNTLIDARLRAHNIVFENFERDLYRQGIGAGVGTDWVILALNSLAALGTAPASLGAASAGILGARASYEKRALYNQNIIIMMAQMSAKRKSILVTIRAGEQKGLGEYSIFRALDDIDDYGRAGSIPGAMNDIVTNAGSQAKEATEDLKKIDLLVPVSSDVQRRRENAAVAIKAANLSQITLFLQLSEMTPGSTPVVDALNLVDGAKNNDAINTVCIRLSTALAKPGVC